MYHAEARGTLCKADSEAHYLLDNMYILLEVSNTKIQYLQHLHFDLSVEISFPSPNTLILASILLFSTNFVR